MSSIFQPSYVNYFLQRDFDRGVGPFTAGALTPPNDHMASSHNKKSVTLHEIGIRSIFRLSLLRKQHALQTGLQGGTALTSFRTQLDKGEATPQSHTKRPAGRGEPLNQVCAKLNSALREERKLRRNFAVSLGTLSAEVALLVARNDSPDARGPISDSTQTADTLDLEASPTDLGQHLNSHGEPTTCNNDARLPDALVNLCAIISARKTALTDNARLEGECSDCAVSIDVLRDELRCVQEELSAANAKLEDHVTLNARLQESHRTEKTQAHDLAAQLQTKDQDLGALHRSRFALECEYKIAVAHAEGEKAELELSMFALELERDLLLQSEAELTEVVKKKTDALDAAESRLFAEYQAKEDAIADLHATRTQVVSLQVALQESGTQTSGVQAELARVRAELEVQEDLAKVTMLTEALKDSDELCDSLKKQLEGERAAHHETRIDLGLIIRRLASVTAEKDDTQTKLQEAEVSAEEAKTGLEVTTRRLSMELDQLKANAAKEDEEVEAGRQEKIEFEVQAQRAVDELMRENQALEENKKALEEALMGKDERCEELEKELAKLQHRVRVLEKDEDWHTVVPSLGYDVDRVVRPKRSGDKENMHSGSMYDANESRIIPPRRSSNMTTDSVISSTATLVSSSDSRTFATRIFNSQSLRKFFNAPHSKKSASEESPALEYAEPLEDTVRIRDEFDASPLM